MLPISHLGFTVAAVKIAEKALRLKQVDYRIVLAASLLPDLVDKPLSSLLEGSYAYETRAFGHSLVFLGFVGLVMLIHWLWTKKTWFLPLFSGVLLHDVFDEMWLQPVVLFWPFLGWQFSKPTDEAWLRFIQLADYKIRLLDFLDNLSVLILLFFFMKVAFGRRILDFIRGGRL